VYEPVLVSYNNGCPQNHPTFVTNVETIASALRPVFSHCHGSERFVAMHVRSTGEVVGYQMLGAGTLQAVVDTTLMYRGALLSGAEGVVLAHNHVSDDLRLSDDDDDFLRKARLAFRVINIELLHFMVFDSKGDYRSY
jgi:DNA repair protein RadC